MVLVNFVFPIKEPTTGRKVAFLRKSDLAGLDNQAKRG